MTAADVYDRPPYRTAGPRQAGGPAAWVLDAFLPWRLARRIYGPFRLFGFTAADVVGLTGAGALSGRYAQPVATAIAERAIDPVIERLLLPRALLGLGLLVFVLRLATGTGMNDLIDEAFGDSLLMLGTGPVSLLLACVPLVALARPGTRWTVARLATRPLVTALITAGLCGLFVYWASHGGANYHPRSVTALLVSLILGPWLVVFFGSVLYLIHRNTFSVGGHPLVRPLACVPLAWLTAVGHALFIDFAYAYPHADPHPAYFVALFAGPVGVTVTAVIEVILLRRRQGVGFRGPLPGWTPPRPRITPIPGDLVARLRANVVQCHSYAWPQVTDRNDVVWAVTPVTWARQTVMWPYVPSFTEETRPMLRSDLEATAGPLTPRYQPGAGF
ncbi:hypothetical protein [Streptomyces sp. NBC_00557]|uniref:hypothetical protein n=1 Tax=Streptomyces sp. NBC_00557 TaxID=2975776 RepID=UPI002E81B798|nr:hypothetical protein [Streptomyces sp. NBC_00557]WUC35964.1 hypothetical protein OG956_17930 [Streptomyces sp. NBC_00557]